MKKITIIITLLLSVLFINAQKINGLEIMEYSDNTNYLIKYETEHYFNIISFVSNEIKIRKDSLFVLNLEESDSIDYENEYRDNTRIYMINKQAYYAINVLHDSMRSNVDRIINTVYIKTDKKDGFVDYEKVWVRAEKDNK